MTIVKEGQMFKKRDVVKGWRARYFKLHSNGDLIYFKSKSDQTHIRDTIHLDKFTTVDFQGKISHKHGDDDEVNHYPFTIVLLHNGQSKSIALSTTTLKETALWVDALNDLIRGFDQAQPPKKSSPNSTDLLPSESALPSTESSDDIAEESSSSSLIAEEKSSTAGNLEDTQVSFTGREKMMKLAFKLNPALYGRIDTALNKMFCLLNQEDLEWNFLGNKNGVTSFSKSDENLTTAKGVGKVHASPSAIAELILDVSKKSLYDVNFDYGKTLRVFDEHSRIDYLAFKPVWPTTPRDFCNIVHWRVLDDGAIVIIGEAFEDDELCPLKEPKYVRGTVSIAGWLIKPASNSSFSEVTYVVKCDLKGNLPSWIVSKATSDSIFQIHAIAQLFDKNKIQQDKSRSSLQNALTFDNQPENEPTVISQSRLGEARDNLVKPKDILGKQDVCIESITGTSTGEHTVDGQTKNTEKQTVPKVPDQIDSMDILSASPPHELDPSSLVRAATIATIVLLYSYWCMGLVVFCCVAICLIYNGVDLWMGPSTMSTRRKVMIASWSPPSSGVILGTMSIDVSETQQYIKAKRAETNEKITITHIVIKALGLALSKTPSVNGRLVLGKYYTARSTDIGCLVALEQGKDLANATIKDVDKKTIHSIAQEIKQKAEKLRHGRDEDFEKSKAILKLLPTFLLRPLLQVVGWLGCSLGMEIPSLGVRAHPFGTAMVTSVGMMGLDLAYAPHTPFAHVPILLTIGAILPKPVVVNNEVVVRPVLTLTATIDHRFIDGSQAARMSKQLRAFIENPELMS